MASKNTELSITLRAIDKATAPIRMVTDRIAKLTGPIRTIAGTGVSKLVDGFKAVGGAVGSLLRSVPLLGGVIAATVGGAVFALKGMIDEFDDLGDKADAIGVDVDFLSQMRYAAEQSGASIEDLDGGLQTFTKNLGLARANAGPLVKFLSGASPVLLKQLKATTSNAEAVDLLAGAMVKLPDAARRAALAQKTLGNAALAPLLARGTAGLQELRAESLARTGSLKETAARAGEADTAMKKLKAATTGVKAALVSGLTPALTTVVEKLDDWLVDHRDDIEKWAKEIGEKLPGAIESVVSSISGAIDKLKGFFDALSSIADLADELTGGDRRERKQAAKAAESLRASAANMTPEQQLAFGQQLQTEGAAMYSQIDGASKSRGVWLNAMSEAYREVGTEIRQKGVEGTDVWGAGVRRNMKDESPANISAEQASMILLGDLKYELAKIAVATRTQSPDVGDQARRSFAAQARAIAPAAAQAVPSKSENKLTVEFKDMPRGTRVNADPKNTDEIDLSLGYQLQPGY